MSGFLTGMDLFDVFSVDFVLLLVKMDIHIELSHLCVLSFQL